MNFRKIGLCGLFFGLLGVCAHAASSPIGGPGPAIVGGGGNLTGFSGNMGSINNNQWNQMMNPGKGSLPSADFSNCNAVVIRCASPKCGGCTSMDLARPIVNGCIQSNPNCKKYGDDLIDSISAQLVANATARAQDAEAAAAAQANAAAAAQSEQQMAAMQAQMQAMQTQVQQANQESAARVEAALAEQQRIAEESAAAAAAAAAMAAENAKITAPAASIAPAVSAPESDATSNAIAMGISADILAREQAGGQILTQLENADIALKRLKTTMQNSFDYAGCDQSGSNCTGPRRVRAFKQKAGEFFDPYEAVLDEVYDALILAQSLGVDITDIYMMLNGSCNVWGQYMCEPCSSANEVSEVEEYIDSRGERQRIYHACQMDIDGKRGYFNVAKDCRDGTCKVSAKQNRCTLLKMLTDQTIVQQNWLDMDQGSSGGIRVACASDALDNSVLFRNRKKQATIDIETLRRMLDQEAPSVMPRGATDASTMYAYCNVGDGNSNDGREMLERLVQNKRIPDGPASNGGKLCWDKLTDRGPASVYVSTTSVSDTNARTAENLKQCLEDCDRRYQSSIKNVVALLQGEKKGCMEDCNARFSSYAGNAATNKSITWSSKEAEDICTRTGGKWENPGCNCQYYKNLNLRYNEETFECE